MGDVSSRLRIAELCIQFKVRAIVIIRPGLLMGRVKFESAKLGT